MLSSRRSSDSWIKPASPVSSEQQAGSLPLAPPAKPQLYVYCHAKLLSQILGGNFCYLLVKYWN